MDTGCWKWIRTEMICIGGYVCVCLAEIGPIFISPYLIFAFSFFFFFYYFFFGVKISGASEVSESISMVRFSK